MIKRENIIKYYTELCRKERVDPLPIKFGSVGKGGAALTYDSKTKKPLYITFNLNTMKDPEVAILHEFTHQKSGIYGHGNNFQREFNKINDKYLYSKLSDLLHETKMIKLLPLYEELLGTIPIIDVEIYKNPKSIKRMKSYLRAISDKLGDLYVANDAHNIIHSEMARRINKFNNATTFNTIPEKFYNKLNPECITWVRKGDTNTFILGESNKFVEFMSKEDLKNYKILLDKVRQKNPQFNFIFTSPHWDREEVLLESRDMASIIKFYIKRIKNQDDANEVYAKIKSFYDNGWLKDREAQQLQLLFDKKGYIRK